MEVRQTRGKYLFIARHGTHTGYYTPIEKELLPEMDAMTMRYICLLKIDNTQQTVAIET